MELGSVIPLTPKWLLELAAGAWLFGDDEDYLPRRREQDAIIAPFGRRHAVKVGYLVGAHTESGGDYDQLFATYQVAFRYGRISNAMSRSPPATATTRACGGFELCLRLTLSTHLD
jgi:hypothetical protein